MQLVRAALCALTAASLAAAWSWTPSTFRGARVWARDNHSATKRNIASFKNKFGYKDERYKRDLVHPLMFTRETRMPSFHPHLRGSTVRHQSRRDKRARGGAEAWQLEDCMTVSSGEEGVWQYTSDGRAETCGLYLVTMPDMLVEVELLDMDVDCDSGLVVMFDGWELNGNVFPGLADHPHSLEQRSRAVCSGAATQRQTRFISSQNAALVSFNIPTPGQGFRVRVTHHPNPDTCNILMSEMTGLFTLRNNLQARNCSLTTLLFPANFEVRSLTVGAETSRHRRAALGAGAGAGAGVSSSCAPADWVELGGSTELDSSRLQTSATLCGQQTSPGKGLTVLCGSSTVRLVSSGEYDNSVTVLVKAATNADLDYDRNLIMTCPEFSVAAP